MILSTADLRESPLVENPADDDEPVWTPDGKGIVFRSNRRSTDDLWLQSVAGGRPMGTPQMVRAEVGRVSLLGISRTGTLAYNSKVNLNYAYTVQYDPETGRAGEAARLGDRVISPGAPSWSPDSRTLALLRPGPERLVLYTLATGEERQLPLDLSRSVLSGWFPDGRSLLVSGLDSQGKERLFRYYLDPVHVEPLRQMGLWWQRRPISPDGKVIYLTAANQDGKKNSLNALDMDSGEVRVVASTTGLGRVALAPDGRQLAYLEWAGDDKTALWVVDVGGGTPRRVTATERIESMTWQPNGRHLLVGVYDAARKRTEIRRVSVADGTSQPIGLAMEGSPNGLSISADGRKLAFDGGVSKTETWVLENFLPKPVAAAAKLK